MHKELAKASTAAFLVAMVTLMVELILTRLFDVLLTTNISYLVITCIVFSLGLSGVYVAIRPIQDIFVVFSRLRYLLMIYAVSILASIYFINVLPFDLDKVAEQPALQFFSFGGLFLLLIVPFVFAGMVFSYLFSAYARHIQTLYFFDLVGAAIGCVAIVPLLPHIGPGGILVLSGALMMLCGSLFLQGKVAQRTGYALALVVAICGVIGGDDWFSFRYHTDKRNVLSDIEAGKREYGLWDPVSRIDVLGIADHQKHLAYDGGNQSSHFYRFNGDFEELRQKLMDNVQLHFWGLGELGSHYLKRDTGHQALIIGAAGSKETKAALMFGASRVYAVELVGTVITLGKTTYADFIGNVYNNPKVNTVVGEGRSYLRSNDKKYDVIQMFSNHTSSSIASGTGALATNYLQTVEAYKEYFSHLNDDGILHINHHIYQRMVVTAAQAWKEMGRIDFARHVLVYKHDDPNLPTMFIKMSPWTQGEVQELDEFYLASKVGQRRNYRKVEDPLHPGEGFLSPAFFEGELPQSLQDTIPYRISVTTDDRPYFNQLRKSMGELSLDEDRFVEESIVNVLNSQLRKKLVPMDLIHLILLPIYAILVAALVIGLPMRFSRIGREQWSSKLPTLTYFSCLGFGFILIEIVLIQVFMKLIGSPLHTYSAVLFGMLLGAGVGSFASGRIGISPLQRWWLPFVGILVSMAVFVLVKDQVITASLSAPLVVRIAISLSIILPIAFFMGMPFPVGVLSIERLGGGAVAWAWALNGVFTVVGGFAAIVISLFAGFTTALVVGCMAYALAYFALRSLTLNFKKSEASDVDGLVVAGAG